MTFAEKVKQARIAAEMTQQQLADAVKVSSRAIKAYEKGQMHPRQGTICLIGQALKVSIRYLTDDTCTNPTEDIEKDEYIVEARTQYGAKGARDVQALLHENAALFAGGEISQEEKDLYFEALTKAYLKSREVAKERFGKKKDV